MENLTIALSLMAIGFVCAILAIIVGWFGWHHKEKPPGPEWEYSVSHLHGEMWEYRAPAGSLLASVRRSEDGRCYIIRLHGSPQLIPTPTAETGRQEVEKHFSRLYGKDL